MMVNCTIDYQCPTPRLKRLKKNRRTLRVHRQLELNAWRELGLTMQGGAREVKSLMLAAVGR